MGKLTKQEISRAALDDFYLFLGIWKTVPYNIPGKYKHEQVESATNLWRAIGNTFYSWKFPDHKGYFAATNFNDKKTKALGIKPSAETIKQKNTEWNREPNKYSECE